MPEITDPSMLAALNGSSAAPAARPSIYRLPADPLAVRRDDRAANADDRAAAAAARAASNDARAASNQAAQLQLERDKFAAQQEKDALAATKGAAPLTAKERADAIAAYQSGASIDRIVQEIRAKGKLGPDSTTGIAGLRDFLPSAANQGYDKAANAARGFAGTALGFTSSQLNTPAEVEAALGSYIPKASAFDSSNADTVERLQNLGNDARTRSIAVLGGIPDANGRVTPVQDDRNAPALPAQVPGGGTGGPGSVWQQTYNTPGGANGAAPAGATTQGVAIDPRVQAELNDYIQKNGRNTDPAALSQFITGLYAKYNTQPGAGIDDYAAYTANALRNGGQINTNIPPETVPLSSAGQLRNNLVNNPVGAGAVGFADAVGLGGVSALAGNDVRALGDASTGNMLGMAAGNIAGSILGTGGIAAAGRNTIGRALPSTIGGGARSQLMRDLGVDALYSGVTGYNQGMDATEATAVGAGGSLIGRGVGRFLGGLTGGVAPTQAASRLRAQGVPTTTGQTLGGFAKSLEDGMTSIPGIGDLVNARRLEGFRNFNRQAMNEAGSPIGATATDLGEDGVAQLRGQVGNAYNRATAGVTVPLDAQLSTDLADVAVASGRLPTDYQTAFDTIGERRVGPLLDRGQMTGEDYQQAQRGLRAARRGAANVGSTGFDQEYRDALTQTMNALEGNMRRGGGDSVVDGLNAANAANRNVGTIESAARSAAGGSGTGENFLFTPNQLQRAGLQTETRYPGSRPMAQLADDAQEVLTSRLPDSGTARRGAQIALSAALPGALGGGGAGLGYLTGGAEGAQSGALTGLALAAALGLGGTRGGQRALDNALFVRPDLLRRIGQGTSRRRGMFGSGFIPLALPLASDR